MGISIDIELTNRCNADCHFCPRDMTPHQGLMSPEVFTQALRRAVELRENIDAESAASLSVNLCGLGEPLLNKHAPTFVRQVREAGFACAMSSNGSLLDERRATQVLDAGLQRIFINASERDADYESVYGLPFEKTYDNVVRFIREAEGRCEVNIVLVDHRFDKEHLAAMTEFWRGAGATRFVTFDVMNRGGALFVDHMQYEEYPEAAVARDLLTVDGLDPLCMAPIQSHFVGYDGQYYLCCSDWKKEAPLGSVFDETFHSILAVKRQHMLSREPVCRTCNIDPINRITEELRALAEGKTDQATLDGLIHGMVTTSAALHAGLAAAIPDDAVPAPGPERRRRIPVRVD